MKEADQDKKTTEMSTEATLSILWIFLLFNYIYCDLFTAFDPTILKSLVTTGSSGGFEFTQVFLFGFSVIMEIPIAMVLLSRILKPRANRWANIIGGTMMAAVQISSLFGSPTMYYIFFSIIEIVCLFWIIWSAWKWHDPIDI
jgi:MFS family permease